MTGKAVIVFNFPEPEDSMRLASIIDRSKQVFNDMSDMKILLARADAAETIMDVFKTTHIPDGNLVEHAKRELELLGETDEGFKASIINAVRGFASYGHSGSSAAAGIALVHDLLQFKNLTPLTDNPNEWMHVAEEISGRPGGVWQSRRNPEAFSNDGGKTYDLLSQRDTNGNPTVKHVSIAHDKE